LPPNNILSAVNNIETIVEHMIFVAMEPPFERIAVEIKVNRAAKLRIASI